MQRVFLGDSAKRQPLGAESLCFQPGALVHLVVAVLDVAQYRMSQIRQMRTDLMGAARDQPDAAERKRPCLPDDRHLGDDLLVALALPGVDAHLVGFLAVLQPGHKAALRRRTYRDGQILLLHHVIADDGIQVTQRGVAFGGQHQPLGAAVQPVAQRRGKSLFCMGIILAFGLQIGRKGVHQIGVAGAVTVAEQVRGLVEHRKIFILIHHGHRRLPARRLGGLGGGLAYGEELVVDVQLDQIACVQTGIRLGALAVDLDALIAERLIHHAAGHIPGHALHKAAQAHAVFIGSCGKTFHRVLFKNSSVKTVGKSLFTVYNKTSRT